MEEGRVELERREEGGEGDRKTSKITIHHCLIVKQILLCSIRFIFVRNMH